MSKGQPTTSSHPSELASPQERAWLEPRRAQPAWRRASDGFAPLHEDVPPAHARLSRDRANGHRDSSWSCAVHPCAGRHLPDDRHERRDAGAAPRPARPPRYTYCRLQTLHPCRQQSRRKCHLASADTPLRQPPAAEVAADSARPPVLRLPCSDPQRVDLGRWSHTRQGTSRK